MRRGVRLALDHAQPDRAVRPRSRTRARDVVVREAGDRGGDRGGVGRLGLDEAVHDDERRDGDAEVGAQPREPAVELVQRAREALVARLGDAVRLAVAVGDLDLLGAVADEQLLELRLLLDVALVLAEL